MDQCSDILAQYKKHRRDQQQQRMPVASPMSQLGRLRHDFPDVSFHVKRGSSQAALGGGSTQDDSHQQILASSPPASNYEMSNKKHLLLSDLDETNFHTQDAQRRMASIGRSGALANLTSLSKQQ